MKVVKEAYTETVKVVYDPDYVTIQQMGGEPVHMSIAEAKEVVEWLSHELNRVLPEIMPLKRWDEQMVSDLKALSKPFIAAETYDIKDTKIQKGNAPLAGLERNACSYDPGPRSATQTVEVKVGDPNLAYRGHASRGHGDGATETTDLGALVGKTIIS